MGIHKQELRPTKVISDERLSYRARGIAAAIFFSGRGDLDSIKRIADRGKEGVAAVSAALKELEEFGYLTRSQYHDEAGRMRHSYTLTEPGEGVGK